MPVTNKIAAFQKVALAVLDALEVILLRVVGLGAIIYELLTRIHPHR
jgi:hypothetical protein